VSMAHPSSVTITDVALRDGLQNHARVVPTDVKLALLDRLLAAGVRSMEVTSFVHPGLVPQMADAEQVTAGLPDPPPAEFLALVPNLRGLERAIAAGARHARVVLSVSEGHSRSNTNRSVDEGIAQTREVVRRGREVDGMTVTGALATVFVCPYDGIVPTAQVERVVGSLAELGVTEISLSDTLGKADPDHVERTVEAMRSAFAGITFGLHLHNTYGMALANVAAGLRQGIRQFDAALGGIGGCPFAPGAAGNVATEDVVFMLHAMGVPTGIDLDRLAEAAVDLRAALREPLASSVSRALGWVA
jgi:hydroxymethylglutaryl-CoA lyase